MSAALAIGRPLAALASLGGWDGSPLESAMASPMSAAARPLRANNGRSPEAPAPKNRPVRANRHRHVFDSHIAASPSARRHSAPRTLWGFATRSWSTWPASRGRPRGASSDGGVGSVERACSLSAPMGAGVCQRGGSGRSPRPTRRSPSPSSRSPSVRGLRSIRRGAARRFLRRVQSVAVRLRPLWVRLDGGEVVFVISLQEDLRLEASVFQIGR